MLIRFLSREMRHHEADKDAGGNGEAPPPNPAPDGETPPDDFDKERAMATIRSLRAFEKDAKAKLKRLDELEAERQERTNKELSEAERLKKELTDLRAQHEAATADLQRARLLEAARKAAGKAQLSFHDGALEDALSLGAFDNLEWNDKGEPLGVGEAVKALAKERPYLLKPAATSADLDGARRGTTSKADEDADRAKNRFAAWGIRGNNQ